VGIIVQGSSGGPTASDVQYAFCGSGHVYIRLLGQAIIQWDFRSTNLDVVNAFAEVLNSSKPDIIFSDLELAIRGDHGGTPTRPPALGNHHEAGPWVLDLLKEHGVNILATSNNHAYDLANEGILSTLEELDRTISHMRVLVLPLPMLFAQLNLLSRVESALDWLVLYPLQLSTFMVELRQTPRWV